MVKLTMDVHEPKSIAKHLESLSVPFVRKKITPGDYVVGEVGIERKTLGDFFNSMVRKRLFDQVIRLKSCYPTTVVIVEGDVSDICTHRNPAAFWGAFLAIVMDENVSILFSPDKLETARILRTIWRRQEKGHNSYGLRHKPKMLTMEEKQMFLIQGFPSVGDTLSKSLLEMFGSVRSVMMADKEDLVKVPKIGEKKAENIVRILDEEYGRGQIASQTRQIDSWE
ncbi:MAG: ERCC4 domain-containing protein [Thermoplasmata archaeon]